MNMLKIEYLELEILSPDERVAKLTPAASAGYVVLHTYPYADDPLKVRVYDGRPVILLGDNDTGKWFFGIDDMDMYIEVPVEAIHFATVIYER